MAFGSQCIHNTSTRRPLESDCLLTVERLHLTKANLSRPLLLVGI
jgi:hypothetical protein